MKYDKNTILGFTVLFALLFGYFYYNSTQQKEYAIKEQKIKDSLSAIEQKKQVEEMKDTSTSQPANSTPNSTQQQPLSTRVEHFELENESMKIVFSNKGGSIEKVILKKYLSYEKEPVEIVKPNTWSFDYFVQNPLAKADFISELIFSDPVITYLQDSSITVSFLYGQKEQHYLQHTYTIKPNNYMIDLSVSYSNKATWFSEKDLEIIWKNSLYQLERSATYERTQANVTLVENNQYDYFTIGKDLEKDFEGKIKWLGFRQQFFNQTIFSDIPFQSVKTWSNAGKEDSSKLVIENRFKGKVELPNAPDHFIKFQFYLGPNDYDILAQYNNQLERTVNYGQGLYAFIRPINIYIIMPVFNVLRNIFTNYGIAILFLTLIIRTITSPLAYKGYVSAAKMKSLKPELDELKAKFGDDKQGFALKQMELYRSAGVNPLGGCIPALLQLPIFVSLYYFFNATIEIRGKSFLWCQDISSYDSILNFGFSIPFYGDHVSLFTLLMVVTTIFSTIMGMGMNPAADNSNPALKYMPYIMPIIFLGFFNSMPAALTWYYAVSNVITFGIQMFIQKVVINHDKISEKIKEYRSKPQKKSGWQDRINKYQELQKKMQEMKNKNNKK